jgi:hypothetical protein
MAHLLLHFLFLFLFLVVQFVVFITKCRQFAFLHLENTRTAYVAVVKNEFIFMVRSLSLSVSLSLSFSVSFSLSTNLIAPKIYAKVRVVQYAEFQN